MAFLAPEAIEGGLALGEEALPEVEEVGEEAEVKAEDEYQAHETQMAERNKDPWHQSMQDLFLYKTMAGNNDQQSQPVVVNNNINNNNNGFVRFTPSPGPEQEQQPESPAVEVSKPEDQATDLTKQQNEKDLDAEKKHLDDQQKEIQQLES